MSRPLSCLVNGQDTSIVSVYDRGFAYGDGVFETIGVRGGVMALWEQHYERLEKSCGRLGIDAPAMNLLAEEAAQVNEPPDSICKIIVTRGEGGRGYLPPETPSANRVVMSFPWPDYPDDWFRKGVSLRICDQHLASQPALAGLKHLNRLEQVLARSEWRDPQIAEGLMLDGQGHVIEGTSTNLFAYFGRELTTPKLDLCGVSGIMRRWVIEHFTVRECRLKLGDLRHADAVFVCNSVSGIWPVQHIEGVGSFAVSRVRAIIDQQPWAIR